jgi:hypothetical protein
MKTYYSSRCYTPKQSLSRSLVEPLFVFVCVIVIFAAMLHSGAALDLSPRASTAKDFSLTTR